MMGIWKTLLLATKLTIELFFSLLDMLFSGDVKLDGLCYVVILSLVYMLSLVHTNMTNSICLMDSWTASGGSRLCCLDVCECFCLECYRMQDWCIANCILLYQLARQQVLDVRPWCSEFAKCSAGSDLIISNRLKLVEQCIIMTIAVRILAL